MSDLNFKLCVCVLLCVYVYACLCACVCDYCEYGCMLAYMVMSLTLKLSISQKLYTLKFMVRCVSQVITCMIK